MQKTNYASVDKTIADLHSHCKKLAYGFVNSEAYHDNFELTHRRTVSEVHAQGRSLSILEVGCFTGIVAASLARLGHRVTANDVDFIMDDAVLQNFLVRENVESAKFSLERQPLPFPDSSFDVIVFHSVLAHLNFNPVPLLREFLRILKPNGLVYCATPNALAVRKVLSVLRRQGTLNDVRHFMQNLRVGSSMSVGLIWREYTAQELVDLFQACGFSVKEHKFGLNAANHSPLVKRVPVALMYSIWPSLMPTQIGLFQKSGS